MMRSIGPLRFDHIAGRQQEGALVIERPSRGEPFPPIVIRVAQEIGNLFALRIDDFEALSFPKLERSAF